MRGFGLIRWRHVRKAISEVSRVRGGRKYSPSPGPYGVSKNQSHCGRGAELIEGAWKLESEKYLPSQCRGCEQALQVQGEERGGAGETTSYREHCGRPLM